MGSSDRLRPGRSSFMEELLEVAEVIAGATSRSLLVLDEPGRGTSAHDGAAIARATLEHFIREVRPLTLCVTHYPAVCQLQQTFPLRVANHHMAFVAADTGVVFLYRLACGAAGRSYGLNVARLARLPESVLNAAAEKAQQLENRVARRRKRLRMFADVLEVQDRSSLLRWLQENESNEQNKQNEQNE